MTHFFNYRCILPGDAEVPAAATFSVAEIKTLHNVLLDAIDFADRHENTTYPEQLHLSGKLEQLLADQEARAKSASHLTLNEHQNRRVRV